MGTGKVYRAIGLMSGTSLDGVDAALLETDGHDFVRPMGFFSLLYTEEEREVIRANFGRAERSAAAEKIVTDRHIEAVRALLEQEKIAAGDVEVIGFHGQTVYHNPAQRVTVQIGDAARLAREVGIQTVADFRSADVKAGGQGAPLLPLYHAARIKGDNIEPPVAVLNIGGVANVTWIGADKILAFDTGPGNALIDDWVKSHDCGDYDKDGMYASKGTINKNILEKLLANSYFEARPPKSLDRDAWDVSALKGLSCEDGAATLAAFTVEAVKRALDFFPERPRQWLVTGGGRHNAFLLNYLGIVLAAPVNPVEKLGWNGDAVEAEGFAYLAVRSLLGEPLSLPETTGVPRPLTGGVLYKP
ncbi:MAG: anhydro-N-acetylmuramic acid kinase [Alphaproteobacteria bacterium]